MGDPPTPLTLIGGFLGAGKTSLVNHLLTETHGRRLAVLVNDFGAINIDARLIESVAGESVTLANGCVCCSIRGDLLAAASRLLREDPAPEHVVVELSGVSRLVGVTETFLLPEVAARFELRSAISVIDAELASVDTQESERWSALDQLRFADLIVLNKTDLVSPRALDRVRTRIRQAVVNARVWESTHGVVPTELLLGERDVRFDPPSAVGRPGFREPSGDRHQEFATWSFRGRSEWSMMVVQRLVDALPPGVYRGKGIVRLDLPTGEHGEFQMTGKRAWLKLRPHDDGTRGPETELVFVGTPGCMTDQALDSLAVTAEDDHRRDELERRSYLLNDLRSLEVLFV